MTRLILLDSGPLGMVTNPKAEAASLWAEARQTGQHTADPKALDGDVILSAQARLLSNDSTEVIVATTNVAHLSRFITALDWQAIT